MAVGTIFLDIAVGERVSKIELCLSKSDIEALYEEAFAGACPVCHSDVDPPGVVCCECFRKESTFHADCCLKEEEEK